MMDWRKLMPVLVLVTERSNRPLPEPGNFWQTDPAGQSAETSPPSISRL